MTVSCRHAVIPRMPLCLILRYSYAVGIQRKENTYFIFSPVQPFKNGIAHLFCTKGINVESKCGNHRESIHIGIIPVLQTDIPLYLVFFQYTAFTYGSDGGTECRGDYPEQLHYFRLAHPYTGNVLRQYDSAVFTHCYDASFHTHAIEGYTSFILSPILSSSMEKSLSSFSVVILA